MLLVARIISVSDGATSQVAYNPLLVVWQQKRKNMLQIPGAGLPSLADRYKYIIMQLAFFTTHGLLCIGSLWRSYPV